MSRGERGRVSRRTLLKSALGLAGAASIGGVTGILRGVRGNE